MRQVRSAACSDRPKGDITVDETVILTSSPAQTEALGEELARTLPAGSVLALFGGMGMGKTCFARGIARGLGLADEVASPTFAIVSEHRLTPEGEPAPIPLFHFDMFRISSEEELFFTGFYEYLEEGGILLIEWSENIQPWLPEGTHPITFERLSQEERRITLPQSLPFSRKDDRK
ncbi:MAG: tRNA (adenosine(37)-N6)-threonylcarbamoyltransferase complex ATPase subunit type 1 TsaE [Oscillospiraceae bacterium]|nr:tRNA (adenosine(37)-N6)-threonylcarbamoyltransferase complex ATPase subunit type 1 TsaE [Oscillospiraceae bacterium]